MYISCIYLRKTLTLRYTRRCFQTNSQSWRNVYSELFQLKAIPTLATRRKMEAQPFTVLVEGNIGSGKTTFLRYFEKYQNDICLITEPVQKWRNVGGINLLDLMYKDAQRWAMPFQSYVTLTMLQAHTQQTPKRVKIMERSVYSSRFCFVENLYNNGSLDQGMYNVLQEWYKYIDENIPIRADLIIYLRTTPEVVYERMRTRARSEESCVPLKYIKELHELHENWLLGPNKQTRSQVTVIDADCDLDSMLLAYESSQARIFDEASLRDSQPKLVLVSPCKQRGLGD